MGAFKFKGNEKQRRARGSEEGAQVFFPLGNDRF